MMMMMMMMMTVVTHVLSGVQDVLKFPDVEEGVPLTVF